MQVEHKKNNREVYAIPPIEQKTLDGWGTVSFSRGSAMPVGD
jgi:hypothetical protein